MSDVDESFTKPDEHSYDAYPENTEDQGAYDAYPVSSEEVFSPPPFVKKERRYSGMEIPFGVIDSGANAVHDVNPMRSSKRFSTLGMPPVEQHDEDIPFGVDDRLSTVHDFNPMRKDSGKFKPMTPPPSEVHEEEVTFGVKETLGFGVNHVNPLRKNSGRFSVSPGNSPQKPAQAAGTQSILLSQCLDFCNLVHSFRLFDCTL